MTRRRLSVLFGQALRLAALLILCSGLSGVPAAFAQAANIYYVYDDLGRLAAVVDQQGNSAAYIYDVVGNITRIDRVDVANLPGAVGISLFAPGAGRVGATIEIFGKGFDATPSNNTVTFNGTAATVLTAATNRLTANVPTGATTGLIAVTTPLGSATSSSSFTVVGALAVSPASVTLNLNGTQQFAATENGNPTSNVTWSVNGITGGDATTGTISSSGLYTAPATVPATTTFTIAATHQANRSSSATAAATVLGVPRTVIQNLQKAVSVSVASDAAYLGSLPVSVSVAPVITALSPNSGARGTTNLTVTLTGSGFTGATGLNFLLSNVADTNITVSSLVPSGGGTQATAVISIAPGAAVGGRVVQILTPSGNSTKAAIGGNVFTVQ
jgi:YD repeat-containing protein